MPMIADAAKDAALNYIRTNTTQLFICSAEPTTFAQASSTYKLCTKASPSLGALGAGTPSGRKFTVAAIAVGDGGVVNAGGTGAYWALCSASELLAVKALAAGLPVATGSPFTLTAFDVTLLEAT